MSKDNLIFIASVLTAPILSVIVTGLLNRKKTGAETHNINIGGEISISESWQKYALQQQKDKDELRKEFKAQIDELKADHAKEIELLKAIANEKDNRIKMLEGRVQELEIEAAKHKTT